MARDGCCEENISAEAELLRKGCRKTVKAKSLLLKTTKERRSNWEKRVLPEVFTSLGPRMNRVSRTEKK